MGTHARTHPCSRQIPFLQIWHRPIHRPICQSSKKMSPQTTGNGKAAIDLRWPRCRTLWHLRCASPATDLSQCSLPALRHHGPSRLEPDSLQGHLSTQRDTFREGGWEREQRRFVTRDLDTCAGREYDHAERCQNATRKRRRRRMKDSESIARVCQQ